MSLNKNWLKVSIQVEGADPEEVAGALAHHLGGAVQVDEDGEDQPIIRAWLPEYPEGRDKARNLTVELGAVFPESEITLVEITETADEDWMAQWRKTVKPITMGERILVVPTFDRPPPGHGRMEVVLDPGMAFGSGHHPSTELCAMALESYTGRRILDIGCGSGILAIIAALLGAEMVLGVDTDPEAVKAASDNVELNNVADKIGLAICGPQGVRGAFDVITANLFLNAHLALAGEYRRLTAPGGRAILSGLKNDQAKSAAVRMGDAGFTLEKSMEKEGWTGLVFARVGSVDSTAQR